MIYQFATTVTNLILLVQCLSMGSYLQHFAMGSPLYPWTMIFMVISGLAYGAGAIEHGVFNSQPSLGRSIAGMFVMGLAGVMSYCMAMMAGRLLFAQQVLAAWNLGWLFMVVGYLVYCIVATMRYGTVSFLYALLLSVPAIFSLMGALVYHYFLTSNQAYLLVFVGLVVALLAAVQQQMRIAIDPVHFDHNAVYHIILMVSYGIVFVGFKGGI